jgi:GR25 family glycosyltransferase involved in LPS biosynthesis
MLNELQRWFPNIEYEFVEELDQEDLTDDIIQENFDLLSFKNRFGRDMLRSEMSLCMKYKKAINDISELPEGEDFFILEDDVIFKEDPLNYIEAMNRLCDEHKLKYDCVFLGEAWIRRDDNRDIFGKKDHPATNGLCTVLYTKESVKKLNKYLQSTKITQPLDWQFNDAFEQLDFDVYWGKALTRHGSVLALDGEDFKNFKSTLRDTY